jgi:hypothetical protein
MLFSDLRKEPVYGEHERKWGEMTKIEQRQEWLSALNGFFERQLSLKPLPPREDLPKREEFQCRILGGALIGWLDRHGPPLLHEREFFRDLTNVESDPAIVITSGVPGLVAASQILNPKPDSIFFFSPEEFAVFLKEHPDDLLCWHVEYSSFFSDRLSPEELARASRQHPLQVGEQFWLHRRNDDAGRALRPGRRPFVEVGWRRCDAVGRGVQ